MDLADILEFFLIPMFFFTTDGGIEKLHWITPRGIKCSEVAGGREARSIERRPVHAPISDPPQIVENAPSKKNRMGARKFAANLGNTIIVVGIFNQKVSNIGEIGGWGWGLAFLRSKRHFFDQKLLG